MTDDIVERLREEWTYDNEDLMNEAAEEIERLRGDLLRSEAVIEAARAWCRETVAAGWSDWSMVISFVRDDFAPRELALFDAIISYDKERDDG